MKENISIIGTGLMGRGLAQVFSLAGHHVNIYDAFTEALWAAPDNISREMGMSVEAGLLEAQEAESAVSLISPQVDLEEALKGVELVIECIPEKMELKQNIFKSLDEICPQNVILATNTSVMSITEIASKSTYKHRIIGTHFWNPPHLIPLVEVVQTENTSLTVVEKTMSILQKAGKKPIHVKKDVPGFVANRMQHALWREAFHILDEGIADAGTIDEAVRYSFGLRLPQLGPLENADMIGLDLTFDIHNYICKFLADNKEPSVTLKNLVDKGFLGFKSNGQGFQAWSENDMNNSRNNLFKYLLDVTVRKKNENNGS
ncbi:MAG: 3-hydroxyacyl-CoA dehydrogenase family protein [Deltaproteobacteria bacterium]|nr:3-hydroxyacyl-CoA dehydrogenase family protein [Deltaproteobacteria bacterium]